MVKSRALRHVRRGSLFLFVGLVGFLLDAVIYNLLVFAGGHGPLFDYPLVAKSISLLISLAASFIGNKALTYRDRPAPLSLRQLTLFTLVNVVAVLLQMACLAFSRFVLGLADPVADNLWGTLIGQAVATVVRYVGYTKWVFPATAPGTAPDEA